MKTLLRPQALCPGDRVALVSLSWGGAGDPNLIWRYRQGKEQLEQVFGLDAVEMPYTLAGTDFIYQHPEKRAQDLMDAFRDPSIKGIVSCIGGVDSIRLLPHIDFEVIRQNPKVFLGYSDTTTSHLFCFKAGLSSVYGPALLVDFAENGGMHPYTVEHLKRALFGTAPLGPILPSPEWTSQYLAWEEKNKHRQRTYSPNHGYALLQGSGKVTGRLLGGCFEVFDSLRGTPLFPDLADFEDAILFFETSEDKPPAWFLECGLRSYGVCGILDRIKGMVWGKPMDETNYEAYQQTIGAVMKEFGKEDLPILCNLNFGHTEPKCCIPYGALAQIDCENRRFSILESAVE